MNQNKYDVDETQVTAMNGVLMFGVMVVLALIGLSFTFVAVTTGNIMMGVLAFVAGVLAVIIVMGLTTVEPNRVVLLQFFGKYVGTVEDTGLIFVNPLMTKTHVSMRKHNFSTEQVKVNDKRGNPIVLSAMISWRVKDATKATFNVQNYVEFIENQVEGILAEVAAKYSYDSEEAGEKVFRKNSEEIANQVHELLQKRIISAGLEILDVRFNHSAYAVEIAAAMLKKQQAEAMIDARRKIVIGAHEMVIDLIDKMEESKKVSFTEEDKVKLVTNLMTVLVSDTQANPVVQMN